jgi:RimJ/RimL family protein N-acetyltransferase
MTASYTYLPVTLADREPLADWLASETWPFHVNSNPGRERFLAWTDDGAFISDDTQSFWMLVDGERIGLLKFDELTDPSPSVDLRLRASARGHGHGVAALRWMTAHAFTTWPQFQRIEGCTREDNLAMRRLFKKVGYVKEGYIRAGWPVEGGPPLASIRYAILRSDWESGTVTPVCWDDE